MDVTKPYKFIGFGAMDVTKPYKLIGFAAMDVTKTARARHWARADGPLSVAAVTTDITSTTGIANRGQ